MRHLALRALPAIVNVSSEPSVRSPGPIDPNMIPVSPSGSALDRLSLFEPAPSLATSDSRSTLSSPPHPQSESVPSTEGLPEIPDYNSKSSKRAPIPIPPPKKSKLSLLASSRASTVTSRSESSRSSGIALTGSVKTFPALRPSAQSARPPSSAAPSYMPLPPGENTEYYNPSIATSSPTSSLVLRAIQTAMDLEAADREAFSDKESGKPETPSHLLSATSPAPNQSPTHPYKEVQTFRSPPSKLVLLAMAKTNATKRSKLPKPVTEYLAPTANGPTATTAITTSYQSLYSLTDPTRSPVIPEQYVVPLGGTSPKPGKSKLAMKIKKANEKQKVALPLEEEDDIPSVLPIFHPKPSAHVRASPSAFASLLVDDPLITPEAKGKHRATSHQEKGKKRDKSVRVSTVSEEASDATRENRNTRSRRRGSEQLAIPDFSAPMGFSFDTPSPDDIVFNARRGTPLGQQKNHSSSSSSPRKPIPSSK